MWRLKPRGHKIGSTTKNCPKHIDRLPCLIDHGTGIRDKLIYLAVAGASDLPHSRQDELDRGVISPQNGHILCDAYPRTGGASVANSLETEAAKVANLLRKRSRS